jgi:nucleoside-diphosphate-sugar epimerase
MRWLLDIIWSQSDRPMESKICVVTGASGFVGRRVVSALARRGWKVVAGVHRNSPETRSRIAENVTIVPLDILDRESVRAALEGAYAVLHFAARVDADCPVEQLYSINVDGTKIVWECAAASGVTKALYCSTAAVYGLLANSAEAIAETVRPCAVEPYGRTKYQGEQIAVELGIRYHLHTTILRPVAIFGPGEHSPFGNKLREAAVSKFLIAGAFANRHFSYVHVDDVAAAAVFLMENDFPSREVFNIAVPSPIKFEDAFVAYRQVLARLGRSFVKVRMLALISWALHRRPFVINWISKMLGRRWFFIVWKPGFDRMYSSAKLLQTQFRFRHTDFEEVFSSCIEPEDQ